ncbi:MAG: carbohydrate ABC transporter permease [Clostridiaceae bacterium]|nr:carbohydrate ABC transporter permease [Clostridiaceae bacterium]
MRNKNIGDLAFDILNLIFMLGLIFVTLYPLYYVLCASLSDNTYLVAHPGVLFWPHGFTLGAYRMTFEHPLILSGYRNILFILAAALPLNIIMTLFCGFFMASKGVLFKKIIVIFMMFTMFFSGGLIPGYLNIRDLGLFNTLWALIIPGCLSLYNAIICKTAIEGIPDGLIESAHIDGANDLMILFTIIAPLIMPTTAVLLLYYGVGHWNNWFTASIYITDSELLPIQNVLRALLITNSEILGSGAIVGDEFDSYAETIKYAAIIVTTVPVLCIYPFLQKYFVKGVMIGAVKG